MNGDNGQLSQYEVIIRDLLSYLLFMIEHWYSFPYNWILYNSPQYA